MNGSRYLEDVVTLSFDVEKCTGCEMCVRVCPHAVFEMTDRPARARVADRDACMECGACARNCEFGAIAVQAGVGCASAIIASWFRGGEVSCGPGDPAGSSSTTGCC
jgi:NAD-dependent dihydropyrimidine dehydrogenase PreA subunit